jgi:hypothetical protein
MRRIRTCAKCAKAKAAKALKANGGGSDTSTSAITPLAMTEAFLLAKNGRVYAKREVEAVRRGVLHSRC